MRKLFPALLLCAVLAVAAWATSNRAPEASSSPEVGAPAPAFTLTDTYGNEHSLSDFEGKFVVLEWLNFGCPFVQKHYNSGNIPQLQQQYVDEGVIWLSVVSSAPGKQGHYPPDEMNAQVEAHNGTQTAVLMDESGTVGRAYDARTTPHMFVINPEGILLYKGGIDDKPTTNVADLETATNYVAAALDAAMAGEEVEVTAAQPYGCDVKYAN